MRSATSRPASSGSARGSSGSSPGSTPRSPHVPARSAPSLPRASSPCSRGNRASSVVWRSGSSSVSSRPEASRSVPARVNERRRPRHRDLARGARAGEREEQDEIAGERLQEGAQRREGETREHPRCASDADANREPRGGRRRQARARRGERKDEHEHEQRRGREEQRIRDQQERALHADDEEPAPVARQHLAEAPATRRRTRELRRDHDRATRGAEASGELHVLAEVSGERTEATDGLQRVASHGKELADEAARIDSGEEGKGVQ